MPAGKETLFPTPDQVSNTDIATLRSAGLSGRKAEYVKDIAARFADGRLSTEKLSTVSDEELYELLIDVRGVGPWTVHMFSIFTLRRPNILPVGDLGVQRGVLRWFYYWHNPSTTSSPVKIHPEKLPKSLTPGGDVEETAAQPGADEVDIPKEEEPSPAAGASAVLPAPPVTPKKGGAAHDTNCDFPEAFTPSIKRTLASQELNRVTPPPPLPKGLSVSELKSRLDGKKKQKGAFLTPAEMEELTECWKPYRSLGVYYMWALSEEKE
ncbi:DNA glycosylase [Sistotremastrum niveocremeum HHB9708]|uniref:DNA glycosylase n=1 Tax=Sistotremastrum niveocremeum HHB9708 TaxID=1314777 RepID=A0A164ZZR4_9AGAM|nr:DNA glycosylase [Sistotremastrum niveocremeum HHB9708]